MNPESCSMLYTCSKVRMTPMIRVLLRCTATEAMKSICVDCEEWQEEGNSPANVSAENEKDHTYISPSGQRIMVMVGNKNGQEEMSLDGDTP